VRPHGIVALALLTACQALPEATPSAAPLAARADGNQAVLACFEHFRFLFESLAPEPRDHEGGRRGLRVFNDRRLHGLGGNGRACADCHMASHDFTLTPAVAQARLDAMRGCRQVLPWADDPLFRPIDADDFRTRGEDASDYSNLVENGLIRVTLPLPDNVKLLDCGATVPCPSTAQPTTENVADVWRAVPTIENVALTGPDDQEPAWIRGPNTRGGYQADARIGTLQDQARSALLGHALVDAEPPQSLLDDVAAFQSGEFSSRRVAELAATIGEDPLPPVAALTELEQHGRTVFVRACGHCHGGPGLSTPQMAPAPFVPDLTAMPRYHTVQVDCPRPVDTMTPPRFVFPACPASLARNVRTYEFTRGDGTKFRRSTSDPGRALLSGADVGNPFTSDFQRYDVPSLHGIGNTAPYFHNNAAATMEDVLDLYDAFFKQVKAINPASFVLSTTTPGANDRPFTKEERPALLAFLRKL
jgi:cytochrome c peroxidase